MDYNLADRGTYTIYLEGVVPDAEPAAQPLVA
jgi:hypothetical protein